MFLGLAILNVMLAGEKRARWAQNTAWASGLENSAVVKHRLCFNNCFLFGVLTLFAITVASVSIPERLEREERQRHHLWHRRRQESLSRTAALTRQPRRGVGGASADSHPIWTLNGHSSPCFSFHFTRMWKRPVAGACLKTKSFNKQSLNDWKNRGNGCIESKDGAVGARHKITSSIKSHLLFSPQEISKAGVVFLGGWCFFYIKPPHWVF